jgi:hypothetical protein
MYSTVLDISIPEWIYSLDTFSCDHTTTVVYKISLIPESYNRGNEKLLST